MDHDVPSAMVVYPEGPERAALCELLAACGLSVLPRGEGSELVKQACLQAPALILLALELPGVDSLASLRMLRAIDGCLDARVIALGGDRSRRLHALELGADDALALPCDPEELTVRVRRSLAQKQRLDSLIRENGDLHTLSVTDGLTQIHNHRFFKDRLADEFRRAHRYQDPLALIILDLDHFKAVNDGFGHPVGDEVLRDVAQALRRSVRETDLLSRYGGEEFAVLLPKTPLLGALTVAERVWRELGSLRLGPGGRVRVTASVGVSCYPLAEVPCHEALLQSADAALYHAKEQGRDRVCLADGLRALIQPTLQTA